MGRVARARRGSFNPCALVHDDDLAAVTDDALGPHGVERLRVDPEAVHERSLFSKRFESSRLQNLESIPELPSVR